MVHRHTCKICEWVLSWVGLGPVPGVSSNQQPPSLCYEVLELGSMVVAVGRADKHAQVLSEAGLLALQP